MNKAKFNQVIQAQEFSRTLLKAEIMDLRRHLDNAHRQLAWRRWPWYRHLWFRLHLPFRRSN